MCSWVIVDCTKTPTVNETCKHATGSFYLKARKKKKVSKDLCSSGCKTQAVHSNITTDWLSSNSTGKFGLSIPEQCSAANSHLGRKKKKTQRCLFQQQTSSVHPVQPELPLSVFYRETRIGTGSQAHALCSFHCVPLLMPKNKLNFPEASNSWTLPATLQQSCCLNVRHLLNAFLFKTKPSTELGCWTWVCKGLIWDRLRH